MKRIDLKKEFREGLKQIKDSRKFIYFIIFLFFGFSIMGYFVTPSEALSAQIFEYIKQLIEKTKDFNLFELIGFIFLNNLKSSFIGLFSGLFFGILSLIHGILNGYILGFVSFYSVAENGLLSLWKILPHGIFELPAIFISLGLGLKLGSFMFVKNKIPFLRRNILGSVKAFFLIILPLLLIGAIIEGLLIFAVN